MKIRAASESDEAQIAQLHLSSGVQGLLSKLSIKTLRFNFYIPIVTDMRNICFVAEADNQVVGFLFYRPDANGTKFDLPKKDIRLMLDLVKALVKKLTILFVAFNVVRTERKTLKLMRNHIFSIGELQILVVDRAFQNQGIGRKLLLALSNLDDVTSIVVKTQSKNAKDFYEENGFTSLLHSKIFSSEIYVLTKGFSQ
jgi:ribosomal protein S18 acetylase RimI-like enzyme